MKMPVRCVVHADRAYTVQANRKVAIPRERALYRQRNKIEIMFGRLKDWRRSRHPFGGLANKMMHPSSKGPPSTRRAGRSAAAFI
jgi:transposase